MDITFTGRGVQVTDEIRGLAEQKLARLGRIEPRATRLDVEVINEHHPTLDGAQAGRGGFADPAKDFPCACRS